MMSLFKWAYQRRFVINIEAKETECWRKWAHNGVFPQHTQNPLVFVFVTRTGHSSFRVCTLSLQTGLLLRYLCYSWGSLYPEFTPAELTGGRGRHLAGGTCKVPAHGRKTGASCCLQLENTLLHSFGYSQIKSFSCITDSSHATHAWMQPVCVSGENIISRWSTFSVGLHPFASC